MFLGVDKGTLSLSIVTPENENQVFFAVGKVMDDGVGKLFPTFILMTTGLVSSYRESSVEK